VPACSSTPSRSSALLVKPLGLVVAAGANGKTEDCSMCLADKCSVVFLRLLPCDVVCAVRVCMVYEVLGRGGVEGLHCTAHHFYRWAVVFSLIRRIVIFLLYDWADLCFGSNIGRWTDSISRWALRCVTDSSGDRLEG